ncbi:MAG TPA: ABC transporter ATP-binding protein [Thermoanaerobaculia bacterium]|nr:ABC transporter ATP-binding protein [Thermoanaerobaculia bacterium]
MRRLRQLRLARLGERPGRLGILVAGSLAGCGYTAAQLAIPLVMGSIIDDALLRHDARVLAARSALLVAVALASSLCRGAHLMAFTSMGERYLIALRRAMLAGLQARPLSLLTGERSGRLHALFTEDAPTLAKLANQIAGQGVLCVTQLAGLLTLLSVKYGALVLIVLLIIPVYVVFPAFFSRRNRAAARATMEARAEVNATLQESIQAVREIKVFDREQWSLRRLEPLFARNLAAQLRVAFLQSAYGLNYALFFLIGGLLYWYGGLQVLSGRHTVGELVALVGLVSFLTQPVQLAVTLNAELQSVLGSADRVLPLLEPGPPAASDHGRTELPPRPHSVSFSNVTFRYDGAGTPALRGVSFELAPGQRAALVGVSGAGKSTLVNLLLRLYEPESGAIQLDGGDIRHYSQASLRREVGVVLQDPILFAGTVRENLRFGRLDATDEELEAAARVANAHDFIVELPAGYDTEIGERAVKLSGGQRQRLAIARVVLRKPGLLILDEAMSALDAQSDLAVREALERVLEGRTSLVIAHRLATVLDAAVILVLDRGRLIARGRHQDLLRSCPLYRDLARLQLQGDPDGEPALQGLGGEEAR